MDAANYVAPTSNGNFVVVVDGQVVGEFRTQNEAENAYNANRGGGGGGTPPAAPAPGAAGGGPYDPNKVVQTREGPRTLADVAAGLQAAGYSGPWDEATMVAKFNGAGGGGGGGAYGGGYGGGGTGSSGWGGFMDNVARSNREYFEFQVQEAARRYALAVTAEERNQAYLDLQRWQAELNKVQAEQGLYTDVAKTVLGAATQLASRPDDYVRYNQVVSGGRDIFDVMSGKSAPGAAFGGPAGQIRPGSVEDMLGRLGLKYPTTPETPAGVQPGAANPPMGSGAGTGAGGADATAYPSREERKGGLRHAGWGGNYDDPNAVDEAWWNADPNRRGKPRPKLLD